MGEYTTIWEDFELPSKGLIYDKPINPHISLRSMTTAEEMKRLSPTEAPYKVMCDIIEDCMKEKPQMHVCDMAISDYQFLLHKLRIVTYGPEYKMLVSCPKCGEIKEANVNLDALEITEWTDEIPALQIITLPVSNYEIELRFQTPKDLDIIAYRSKEIKKKLKSNLDYSILFTIASLIKKVDGRVLNDLEIQEFVKTMPAKDANYLLARANELNTKLGINSNVEVSCSICDYKFSTPFRITSEFFGPADNGRW